MRDFSVLSRRDVLRMAGAVGGLAVTGMARVWAQSARKIESMAPELDRIIGTSEPIRELATGYGGDIGPAEGPLWWAEGRYLLFNDIHTARRMKYTPGQSATVAMEKTNEANGITRDLQGRLVSAEHLTRRVTRYEPDGSLTVIANSFQGKRLLRPNDVIVKSDGSIYFTDPGGNAAPEQWDVTLSGVYRVSADLGSMSLIIDDMVRPNGLAFSPDESILYVADSRRRHVRAYDMQPNGTIAKETSRVFVDLSGTEPGVPDGIKVDTAGNLYSGGSGGLYIIDSKGKKLGRIVHGQPATTNVAFGGDDWKTLYFTTAKHALFGRREDRGHPGAGEEANDVGKGQRSKVKGARRVKVHDCEGLVGRCDDGAGDRDRCRIARAGTAEGHRWDSHRRGLRGNPAVGRPLQLRGRYARRQRIRVRGSLYARRRLWQDDRVAKRWRSLRARRRRTEADLRLRVTTSRT